MNMLVSIFDDFLSLIYPHVCMSCGKSLFKYEKCICTFCLYHLPRTNFHLDKENPVTRLFWGKAEIHSAASLYYFYKGGRVQQLMHQLKYKGQKEIGIYIGNLYGKELSKSPLFNTAGCIIPVPMHPKKQKKRGYNQSELIALGLSQSMNVPVDAKTLVKTAKTETQTRKSRFSRWENVKEVFELKDYSHLIGKHILLVDDVITTGSTLESCILNLSKVPGIKVSVVSMACAYH
jgi:ComF family protein